MIKSRLLRLLSSLKGRERDRLRLFLFSSYFNHRKELVSLYDAVTETFFQLGNREADRAYVWGKVFPDRAFDDTVMRLLMSDLLKLTESFLSYESFAADQAATDHQLLKALAERDLDDHFSTALRKVRRARQKQPVRNAEHFLEEHMLSAQQRNWAYRQIAIRSKKVDFDAEDRALDLYYLASKIRNTCELLNSAGVLQLEAETILLDEVIDHVRSGNYEGEPAIAVYFSILMMLRDPNDDAYYQRLRELASEHGNRFPQEELWEIYVYAINHCIRRANSGEPAFLQELFDWYRRALEAELLLKNNRLIHWDYKNIVAVGLSVGAFNWVRTFIEQYKPKLAAAQRENAYRYNLARYHFATGDYDRVLELLSSVEYDDVFYNLDAKTMLLKIYFEREEIDALQSLLDSFALYLRRNRIVAEYHRNNYLNLIRFVRKLLGIPHGDKTRLRKLADELEANRQVVDIKWLQERIRAAAQHAR